MITSFLFAKRMEVTMIQEEVENKTVNLAIKAVKITGKELYKALKAYMQYIRNHSSSKQTDINIKGKQSPQAG